ncbi:hypothetical protein ANCCEY_02279 [Ancylostoma ceylanicum]|uniref:Uncharacterized protein n=1 Tax=Ancylostoma ceylanicum TaxID=53326 RepID=A0A0D6M866_9BILA|nr:hypothetical protein ANCCEY_02279 [Ancylostoma ceylanicum]
MALEHFFKKRSPAIWSRGTYDLPKRLLSFLTGDLFLSRTFRSECLGFIPSSRKKLPTVSVATRTIVPNKARKGQESI